MREFLAGFECTIDFGLGASLAATAYRVRILAAWSPQAPPLPILVISILSPFYCSG